jgi:hypothetical protein
MTTTTKQRPVLGRDPTNSERAANAHEALLTYADVAGPITEDRRETMIVDLLAHFGHYCDQHGLHFTQCIHDALVHWVDERRTPTGDTLSDKNDVVEITINGHDASRGFLDIP